MSNISQRLETKHKLNPKQILESSIMQLSTYVLEKRILEEVESNPQLTHDIGLRAAYLNDMEMKAAAGKAQAKEKDVELTREDSYVGF